MEEDTLMRRAAAGDSQAFGQLVKAYQAQVVRLAARLLNDMDAARDIAQETFLRVWRARHNYQPQGQFQAYLLRVTRNACLDHLRSRPQWQPLVDVENGVQDLAEAFAVAVCSDVPTKVQANLLMQDVEAAVAGLSEVQRVVFILSHYEGMSYKEIAQALQCPIGTVASRKFQAVETLRRRLYAWNPVGEEATRQQEQDEKDARSQEARSQKR
jgi:RNA polymerase sigma-70 factor (ECF subfamily)